MRDRRTPTPPAPRRQRGRRPHVGNQTWAAPPILGFLHGVRAGHVPSSLLSELPGSMETTRSHAGGDCPLPGLQSQSRAERGRREGEPPGEEQHRWVFLREGTRRWACFGCVCRVWAPPSHVAQCWSSDQRSLRSPRLPAPLPLPAAQRGRSLALSPGAGPPHGCRRPCSPAGHAVPLAARQTGSEEAEPCARRGALSPRDAQAAEFPSLGPAPPKLPSDPGRSVTAGNSASVEFVGNIPTSLETEISPEIRTQLR